MGARTSGREAALQILFSIDASGGLVDTALRHFWREFPGDPEGRAYAESVVRGVREQLADVDRAIQQASQNWRLERMTRIDRNVLRIGVWELRERADLPAAMILDEAVDLAKRFGTEGSGAFVNGVLASVAHAGREGDDLRKAPAKE